MKNNPTAPRIYFRLGGGRGCGCVSEKEPASYCKFLLRNKAHMSDILSPLSVPIGKREHLSGVSPSFHVPVGCYCSHTCTFYSGSLSSGTEAERECPHPVAYPPHLFRLPVKLGNTLYMFPHSPHSTLMRCVLYTDLSLRPCFSRKKGVGPEKKKKKKEEKDPSLLTLSPCSCHSMSSSSLLSSLN